MRDARGKKADAGQALGSDQLSAFRGDFLLELLDVCRLELRFLGDWFAGGC